MAQEDEMVMFFYDADKDGDGQLTFEDLMTSLKKFGFPLSNDDILAFFKLADKSGDEKMSQAEFIQAMKKAPVEIHAAAMLGFIFAHFDKSGDGEINRDELREALSGLGQRVPEANVDKLIDDIDKDHSGTINLQEFLGALEKDVL